MNESLENGYLRKVIQVSHEQIFWSSKTIVKKFYYIDQTLVYLLAKMLLSHSPRPPAPRNIPPTASASHSRDTPIIMQPATMLSRDEPTRSPWYPPTLTGFIQQVESPTCHAQTDGSLQCRWEEHCHSLKLHSLPIIHSLLHWSLSSGEASLFSVSKDFSCIFEVELWFLLPLKIRKLEVLTCMANESYKSDQLSTVASSVMIHKVRSWGVIYRGIKNNSQSSCAIWS